jgi:hypothetical protein
MDEGAFCSDSIQFHFLGDVNVEPEAQLATVGFWQGY